MPDFRNLIDDPEPSQDDIARFFSLDRELDSMALNDEQRQRKREIVGNITQYISSRDRFITFLSALEGLLREARDGNNDQQGTRPEAAREHESHGKFDLYLRPFFFESEAHLRSLVNDQIQSFAKEDLVFLYTVILGMKKTLLAERSSELAGSK